MKQSVFFGFGTALLSLTLALSGYVTGMYVAEQKKVCFGSNVPLSVFASASSESDGVVIATGAFSSGVEAVYYLDSQSANLSAAVISRSTPSFQKSFTRNLRKDLVDATRQFGISVPATPKFLMTTGESDVRNVGAVSNLSRSFIYIAEINTGIVLTYALPNVNERDLVIQDGEIIYWACVRLNEGLGTNLTIPQFNEIPEKTGGSQLIDSSFYQSH